MAFYGIEPGRGEVMQVWVTPRFRGTGIALLLLERVLRWARAQGYNLVEVRAKVSNSRAIRFYEKAGFLKTDISGDEVRLVKADD
jgi:GNAT superfamily N-acetyltransferase